MLVDLWSHVFLVYQMWFQQSFRNISKPFCWTNSVFLSPFCTFPITFSCTIIGEKNRCLKTSFFSLPLDKIRTKVSQLGFSYYSTLFLSPSFNIPTYTFKWIKFYKKASTWEGWSEKKFNDICQCVCGGWRGVGDGGAELPDCSLTLCCIFLSA